MSIGDIVDRYTICILKSERLGLDNSKELDDLQNEIKKYDDLDEYVNKLYNINGEIWDLESDIRRGNENILGLEEVGRRAIKIREKNNLRVNLKNELNSKFCEGYVEVKMNHGSESPPSIVISFTTVPERLSNDKEDGLKLVIKSLCEQDDNDYEVYLNIPYVYNITNRPYIIPEWINELKLKYKHFKVFRCEDIGPPTKFVPTLKRVKNEETILIVVDDDLVYHNEMVKEHRKYQDILKDSVICYDGRGAVNPLYENDIRDSWILCVTEIRETHSLQHYKSASYKVKLFDEDFYNYYLGKTLSDDVLVSQYFSDKKIKIYVVPYEKESHLYMTRESWDIHQGVTTFPILRYASSVPDTGCNHPGILSLQPKFYNPQNMGIKSDNQNIKNYNISYETDKFNHGYIPFYEKEFEIIKNCDNVLEIGIGRGESLFYLRDFFSNANIYGLDVHDCSFCDSERIKTIIGDQSNRIHLSVTMEKINNNLDLIIDDGGHTMRQQQISLGFLFRFLNSGGFYVIEDLHTSNKSPWMDENDNISTLDMLNTFDEKNIIISNHISADEKKYLEENISSIYIWKSPKNPDGSITSIIKKK